MLVWDTSLNRFAEFGSNQEIGFNSHIDSLAFCLLSFGAMGGVRVFGLIFGGILSLIFSVYSQGSEGWTFK